MNEVSLKENHFRKLELLILNEPLPISKNASACQAVLCLCRSSLDVHALILIVHMCYFLWNFLADALYVNVLQNKLQHLPNIQKYAN